MDVFRCALLATLKSGQKDVTTFHVAPGPGSVTFTTSPSAQDLAEAIDGALRTTYRGVLTTADTLDDIVVTQEKDPLNPDALRDAGSVHVGLAGTRSAASTVEPQELCAVVNLHTNAAGRSARGWMFMPPAYASSNLVDGHFDSASAYITAINAFLTELQKGWGGGAAWWTGFNNTWGANVVVYSRTLRARNADNYWFDVVSASVKTTAHWLRSRGKGR